MGLTTYSTMEESWPVPWGEQVDLGAGPPHRQQQKHNGNLLEDNQCVFQSNVLLPFFVKKLRIFSEFLQQQIIAGWEEECKSKS